MEFIRHLSQKEIFVGFQTTRGRQKEIFVDIQPLGDDKKRFVDVQTIRGRQKEIFVDFQPLGDAKVKSAVSGYIQKPEGLQDVRLRWEVGQCIQFDDNYSPLVEKVRQYVFV